MAIVTAFLDGSPADFAIVPREVAGFGIAVLPDGRAAVTARDAADRSVVTLVGPGDSFAAFHEVARSVAVGGDLVAIATDDAVRVGSLAELELGGVPSQRLPLVGADLVGAVAISGDGGAIAVVRLDDNVAASRVEILQRRGEAWQPAGTIALDPIDGTATPAWLP